MHELQNVIERVVILSHSSQVTVGPMLLPRSQTSATQSVDHPVNLGDLERNHIVEILERTKWRIYGAEGAAHLLGLNPETLRSRLRRLGIRRHPAGRLNPVLYPNPVG